MTERQKEALGIVEGNSLAIRHLAYELLERCTGEQAYQVKDKEKFVEDNYRYLYLAAVSILGLAESSEKIIESIY